MNVVTTMQVLLVVFLPVIIVVVKPISILYHYCILYHQKPFIFDKTNACIHRRCSAISVNSANYFLTNGNNNSIKNNNSNNNSKNSNIMIVLVRLFFANINNSKNVDFDARMSLNFPI